MSKYLNDEWDVSLRKGQEGINKDGDKMLITEYKAYNDITVIFLDGNNCKVHTQYINFLKGNVKNYNNVGYGKHGYLGQGEYQTEHRDENGKRIRHPEFEMWRKMHLRAENFDGKHPSYEDVTVCEEWYNYQNFAKWYEENYYEVDGDFMSLDKDIINPFSRVYSPENCCLVPNTINELFKKLTKTNGDLPVGVSYRVDGKVLKYRARTNIFDDNGNITTVSKTFNTVNEAFEFYKYHKENHIKDVADKYFKQIPTRVYDAMYAFKIERNI